MAVNYNDSRLVQVEEDKKQALSNLEQTYGGMIEDSKKFYDEQIQASKDWAEKQSQIQQEQTDFALQQIEQQKEQAQKEYTKQQSAAYVDYKKQSNQYGVEAEKMAGAGLQRTGYSESSNVAMYNAYQNRVAAAKQSIDQAVMNYNNAMTQAQMQNNATLAEIAANALQQQMSLALQGFQYENTLLLQKEEQRQAYDNIFYNRYLDVLNQINTENALAEQIRQYNESIRNEQQQSSGLLIDDTSSSGGLAAIVSAIQGIAGNVAPNAGTAPNRDDTSHKWLTDEALEFYERMRVNPGSRNQRN